MRGSGAALAVLALAAVPAAGHDIAPAPPQDHPILLRGGDLHTVSHGVLEHTDLLFDRGRIVAIGRGLEAPEGAEVIDIAGRQVYPGLIALDTTLGLSEIGAVRATNDTSEVGELTPEVRAAIAYNPDSELIPTVRVHGIAVAQVAPRGGLISGRSFVVELDGWTREDAGLLDPGGLFVNWPGPRLRTGPGAPPLEEQRKRQRETLSRLHDAFETARAYDAARDAGEEQPVDVRWESMRPYVRGERPVFVRANDVRQIEQALDLAEEFGLQIVIVGGREADAVAERLRERNVPVVTGSTAALPAHRDDPYDQAFELPARLARAGVRFAIAHLSAAPWDQRNLPLQAGLAAAYGLPREQALRAITLSPAEILGLADRLGSLDPGKDATLVVSEGDLLDHLGRRVTLLFIEGRKIDLDNRHERLRRKYRAKPAPREAREP
ncbi:MAG: amidohydrolase [Acidobacteria bacterium]|nr:MAG: amidohydrolase [Acidobacteriota bacterium]